MYLFKKWGKKSLRSVTDQKERMEEKAFSEGTLRPY
jgi:hypothetical protein